MRVSGIISFIVALAFALTGCSGNLGKPDWNPTMGRKDKSPYGTYLARQSMQDFFPGANVIELSRSSRFSKLDDKTMYNHTGSTMMVLTGLNFNVSDNEWLKLQEFVREGNELVIFASHFDEKISSAFHIEKTGGGETFPPKDKKELESNRSCLTLAGQPLKRYGYAGRPIDAYFGSNRAELIKQYLEDSTTGTVDATPTAVDTVQAEPSVVSDSTVEVAEEDYSQQEDDSYLLADTLGFANGKPDCLRIPMGRGHITLHAAPLVTTNYFLLQNNNIDYLAGIWSTFPKDVNRIYWDDYYMHSGIESSSNILWKFASTRNGILLALLVGGLYFLMHLKRRQRIIPVIAPLKNDTVSFVETVGRLYYNKGNNANLADKMVQQFLEWVRMNCYMNTSTLNEEFVKQLSARSGQSHATVSELVNMIHEVRMGSVLIDDPYLYQLYRTIQEFYKNHRS